MSRREPPGPGRLRGALTAVGLAVSCGLRPALEWPEVLANVRERYPGVAQLGVAELAAELELPPERAPLLLDARAPAEFAQSHLAGALLAPDEPAALAHLAASDPAREIVVYCSVGMRSSALAEQLHARGFTRVANLEGGIFAWANAGQPTYRGTEREEHVHPFDARWGALLVPERRGP